MPLHFEGLNAVVGPYYDVLEVWLAWPVLERSV